MGSVLTICVPLLGGQDYSFPSQVQSLVSLHLVHLGGCMSRDSGPLGDAFLYSNNETQFCSTEAAGNKGRAAQDLGITWGNDMDDALRNSYFSESKKIGTNDCNDVEWTQLLRGVGKANTENLSKSYNSRCFNCSATSPNDGQQKYHFERHGEVGMPWNLQKAGGGVVAENFFPALVATLPSSTENVNVDNCGAGDLQPSRNGHEQLLADVFSRRNSGYETSTVEASERQTRKDKEFREGEDQSLEIGSHFTRGEHGTAIPHENPFPSSRGLGMPSPASMHQFTRSPNHALRNLFTEKSSGFPCPSQQRAHEDITSQKGVTDEEQLRDVVSKKMKRQQRDGMLGPVPSGQPEYCSGIDSAIPPAPYLRTSLTTPMDNPTYAASSPSLPSFPATPARPPTNLSSVSNSSRAKPSTFQTSGGEMRFPVMDSANGPSSNPPLKDYLSYNLERSNLRREGSVAGVQLLVSERDVYLDLGGQKQSFPNFILLDPQREPLRQAAMFKFSPTGWPPPLDSTVANGNLAFAPWPAGHFCTSPPVSGPQPNPVFSRPRMSYDLEQQWDGRKDGNEPRKSHSAPTMGRRLLIQKLLTSTDVGSLGRIILPKKEAEIHLPHLQCKETIDICMFDYEADRTWTMKYRYWPNNKSRMYLLENTGEFARFHSLQQGDWIYIYRESMAHYVLRAKKMPPIAQVTPVVQCVDGAAPVGASVSKDAETPAISSGTNPTSPAARSEEGPVSVEDGIGTENDGGGGGSEV